MKPNFSSLFLGIALISAGGFALANEKGYLKDLSPIAWILIFAAASALFLVAYFVNGLRAWGWLFPTCLFSALSATIFIADYTTADMWIPTVMVGSLAIPFVAAFAIDRSRTWALIPAFILAFIAIIPPLDNLLKGDLMGALIVAMIGLPFIAAYLISPKAWWSIIPGGILVSIALMISLTNTLSNDMSVAIMFIGWMLTFGLVWKLQSKSWARVPAAVMGVLACIMFLVSMGLENYWAISLIIAGLVLVTLSLRPRAEPMLK